MRDILWHLSLQSGKIKQREKNCLFVYLFFILILLFILGWAFAAERENRAKPTSHDMMAGASLRVDCQPRNGFFFYSYFWKIGKFQTIDEPRHYFHCLFELGVGPEHFCFFVRNVTSTTSKRNDRKMWMKWWPKHFHFYMPISLGLHLLWHQWTRHAFVIVQTNR